jgi:hypothetical protein
MRRVIYKGPVAPPVALHLAASGRQVEVLGDEPIEVTIAEADALIATGEWVAAGGGRTPTVEEIKTDVGADPEKARVALEAEQARPSPRSSLVDHLTAVIDQEA